MKRFILCILLVFTVLISACAEIKTTDDNTTSEEGYESFELITEPSKESSESVEISEDSSAQSVEESSVDSSEEDSKEDIKDESKEEASSQTPNVDYSGVPMPVDKVYIHNGFLISGTRGMEQYFGGLQSGAAFCNIVNNYKKDLGDGVNVYTVVAPHASNYYAPESYSNLIERGRLNFENLKANLSSDVKFVDTYNALWPHVDEPIYLRTECHWGALAAYYAAEEFAKVAGVSFAPLDSYKEIVKTGFLGSAYALSKAEVLRQNPEDFHIYVPQTEYTAYYYNQGNYDLSKPNSTKNTIVFDTKSYAGAFICGDNYMVKVQTKNNTGRKLVILKDSYGNAFAPFTLGSFDEIYILDIRYYKKNAVKFCQEVGATDVAVAVSAFTATGVVYKNLETLRTAP